MRLVGWILVVGGIIQMIAAGSMDVQAPSEPGIANVDLMQQRLLYFVGGSVAFVSGMIWLAIERVRAAILNNQKASAATE